jgi:hypothetical protein
MATTTLKFKWGEVINRSRWSDVFVKHIARFCAQKTGIAKRASTGGELAFLGRGKGLGFREHHYSFTVQRATYTATYRGLGGVKNGRMMLHRRAYGASHFPCEDGYATYKWIGKKPLHSMVEMFVMLMAHEMTHSTDGAINNFTLHGRRNNYDHATCENHTHHRSHDIVEMYRKERKNIMRRVLAELRRERAKQKKKRRRSTTKEKRAKSQANLKRWERKLKLAKTKVAKYKRSVSACDRAIAAKRSE